METMISTMLDEQIEKTLAVIAEVELGSDTAKAALSQLEKLQNQRVKELELALKNKQADDQDYAKSKELRLREEELKQRVISAETEANLRKAELEQKDAELKETKRGRVWSTILGVLGIGVPVAASSYWMYKGMKFEEEGKIYSSRTGQWLASHLRLFGKKG